MALFEEFCELFGVWDEARPFLPLIVDEEEMHLVLSLAGAPARLDELAARLGLDTTQAAGLVERAYGRHVIDRAVEAGAIRVSPSDFYHRLDHFAKFGAWDQLPAEVRQVLDRRYLDEFIARQRAGVERKRSCPDSAESLPNDTVMLLSEVEDMLAAATHITVQPCDCRRLAQNCERPVETCLWLDDLALRALDRGYSRRLSHEQARELVRRADKAGLMHTADAEWRAHGLQVICNCCACDCYIFRTARELDSKGVWPRSRYVAAYDPSVCKLCGTCVKRCHFEAFYHDGTTVEREGKTRPAVRFAAERCWGCGLCANACPSGSIVMERLP